MDLPKRKHLRLNGFDYSQNGAYFITICVQDRACLLGELVGDDALIVPQIQLSPFGTVAEKYLKGIVGLDQYTIMPNHIHFIVNWSQNGTMWASSPTNRSIPQCVKSFKTLVTKEIGCSIFQCSYYDHIIRNEQEYQKIWDYIDKNPANWALDRFYSR